MRFSTCLSVALAILSTNVDAFTKSANVFQHVRPVLKASTATEVANSNVFEGSQESVDFPPPLSRVDRLKRAATFWTTVLPIVANYYGLIGSLKLQEVLGQKMSAEEVEVRWLVLGSWHVKCTFLKSFTHRKLMSGAVGCSTSRWSSEIVRCYYPIERFLCEVSTNYLYPSGSISQAIY